MADETDVGSLNVVITAESQVAAGAEKAKAEARKAKKELDEIFKSPFSGRTTTSDAVEKATKGFAAHRNVATTDKFSYAKEYGTAGPGKYLSMLKADQKAMIQNSATAAWMKEDMRIAKELTADTNNLVKSFNQQSKDLKLPSPEEVLSKVQSNRMRMEALAEAEDKKNLMKQFQAQKANMAWINREREKAERQRIADQNQAWREAQRQQSNAAKMDPSANLKRGIVGGMFGSPMGAASVIGGSALIGAAAGFVGGMAAKVVSSGIGRIKEAVVSLGKETIKTSSDLEMLNLRLDTITKGEGPKYFNQLLKSAIELKAPLESMIESFAKMSAMGFQPTMDQLKGLVNYTRMLGEPGNLDYIVLAFSQIASKGKLEMQEMRQLAERGLPALSIIQEKMKIPMNKIGDIGKLFIPGGVAVKALLDEIKNRTGDIEAQYKKTMMGIVQGIQLQWTLMKKTIGDSGMFESFKSLLAEILRMMESPAILGFAKNIGEVFAELMSGMQKTVNFMKDNWKWLGPSLKYGGIPLSGATLGGSIGAGIGGAIGMLGGPIGMAGGAQIGAGLGALAGAGGVAGYDWMSKKAKSATRPSMTGESQDVDFEPVRRYMQELNNKIRELSVKAPGVELDFAPIQSKIDEVNKQISEMSRAEPGVRLNYRPIKKKIFDINVQIEKASKDSAVSPLNLDPLRKAVDKINRQIEYMSRPGTDEFRKIELDIDTAEIQREMYSSMYDSLGNGIENIVVALDDFWGATVEAIKNLPKNAKEAGQAAWNMKVDWLSLKETAGSLMPSAMLEGSRKFLADTFYDAFYNKGGSNEGLLTEASVEQNALEAQQKAFNDYMLSVRKEIDANLLDTVAIQKIRETVSRKYASGLQKLKTDMDAFFEPLEKEALQAREGPSRNIALDEVSKMKTETINREVADFWDKFWNGVKDISDKSVKGIKRILLGIDKSFAPYEKELNDQLAPYKKRLDDVKARHKAGLADPNASYTTLLGNIIDLQTAEKEYADATKEITDRINRLARSKRGMVLEDIGEYAKESWKTFSDALAEVTLNPFQLAVRKINEEAREFSKGSQQMLDALNEAVKSGVMTLEQRQAIISSSVPMPSDIEELRKGRLEKLNEPQPWSTPVQGSQEARNIMFGGGGPLNKIESNTAKSASVQEQTLTVIRTWTPTVNNTDPIDGLLQ